MKKGVKITLIVIGSLFAIALIGKAIDPGEQKRSNESTQVEEESTELTMAKFKKIENGMTYAQCWNVMGRDGDLLSESEIAGFKNKVYSWSNPDGANCMVTFQDGKVISKAQAGL